MSPHTSRRPAFPHPASSLLFLTLLGILLSGCGYALVGRASNLPEDVRSVYLAPLENGTSRSQVEQILTQAVSDELIVRRRFNLVNNQDDADAVLSGTVTAFSVRPLSFDGDGLADNFEISINADMQFRRRTPDEGGEGDLLWANSRYVFRQDYPLEESGISYFDRELQAIEEVSGRFAQTLVTDLLEGF